MRIGVMLFFLVLILSAWSARAEESKELSEGDLKQAESLLKDLASDDFGVRESAEQRLNKLNPKALPRVREAIATTKDSEVKIRGERVIKALALEGETNADELSRLGKEEALSKHYEIAEKFYAKAAERYALQAGEIKDELAAKELKAKATKATQRQQRAKALAQNSKSEDGVELIGVGGGGRIRVQVNDGGRRVLVLGGGGADDSSDEKADW